jgi:signal transduction histidine kinase
MSNAIWGDPNPTSEEHYPLKLLKGLLQDMLKQVSAYAGCLALYDERINQMVVRLHIRRGEGGELEEELTPEASNGQMRAFLRRNSGALTDKLTPFPDVPRSPRRTEERFITVMTTSPGTLFPPGSSYPLGSDMIGITWRNNQSFHVSQEQYQALRAAGQQPLICETILPSWYLTLPLKEPEQVYEDIDRKYPQSRFQGVIVLYQVAPDGGFLPHQRQIAQQQAERVSLYLQNDRLVRLQMSTRDHIKHLQKISMTFPNTLKLSELVDEIYRFVTNTVDVSSMLLTLYDRDTKKLYDIFAIDHGKRVEGLTDQPVIADPEDRRHWMQMAQKDKNTLLLSTHRNERAEWQIYEELLTGTWGEQANAETFLLIPMKMFTRVVGSLCITSQRPQAYSPLEVLVLETMVQIITVALENAKLYERPRLALKQAKRREEALAATVSGLQAISTVLNVNELLQKFVEILANFAQAEMCSFFQIVPGEDDLVAQAIFDRTGKWKTHNQGKEHHDELIKLIHLPFKESLLEGMINEPFFYLDQPQIKAVAQICGESGKIFLSETYTQQQKMLVIPMRYQSQDIVGLVAIHTPLNHREFQPEEIGILMAISAQAAGAIRNAQLFEQIQEANAELQRMDRVKDEFIVTASHELRTPLSAISGYSSLLKKQSENGRIEAQNVGKYASKIVGSTQQLKDLVENMTLAARMGALDKNLELQLVPSSLLTATETAVNMLNISFEQHIAVEITSDLWVNSDTLRLRQVLTNLLENAAKYSSPQGRILVTARPTRLSWLPENQVDFSILASGVDPEVVHVRVCDEGEGIAAEDAEKIFEKFVRATRSLTTSVRGTGLGLFICRRFIEAMGGRLWLERSIPGKGSIFSFYLMRVPQPITIGEQDEPDTEDEEPTYSTPESIGS